jgi:plasmid stabilization system protein ParE
MAYRVELSVRAERDLDHIYERISADNSAAGAHWFDLLEKAIYRLETLPRRCPIIPESKKTKQGLRHVLYSSMRVIYEIDEARKLVSVITIRHTAMDEFID